MCLGYTTVSPRVTILIMRKHKSKDSKSKARVSRPPLGVKHSCKHCGMFLRLQEDTEGRIIAIECSQFGYHPATSVYRRCRDFFEEDRI